MPKIWIKDESVSRDFLRKQLVGVLALARDRVPYCIPVHFLYLDERNKIYIHSAKVGKKMDIIVENPKVSFLVYEVEKLVSANNPCDFATRYTSVIVHGHARILENSVEKSEILTELVRKYGSGNTAFPQVMPLQADKVAVIEINIKQISCKRNVDC
ncbi:pyridoxamine 5'-phosphate oxidase family protein [Desulfofundulus thermosubterraneus]|uniref:Pyridoxamine 5'-phosphate oxidase n=1 Tax=Desulfofundulus thermosubterraneus DSM 16057 TaxID=1121432 RepID=A0A1M6MLB9_9FIRM|nr:pyridoxamine 5'-phosphate oxidase family protein [Desulfofundulus thermosubterraneus]SHJ84170.1 hypothetical protein SAMN02745219_03467 [Desulfofundulus thermosubterraneus DSM 16057]